MLFFGWVFFRAPDLKTAFHLYQALLGLSAGFDQSYSVVIKQQYFNLHFFFHFALAILASFYGLFLTREERFFSPTARGAIGLLFIALGLVYLSASTYNPFIYYRF